MSKIFCIFVFMKKTYKDIPKNLRREYSKNIRKQLWMAVKAVFKFPAMYKRRKELFNMGEVEDNLNLPDNHLYWYADNTERVGGLQTGPLDFVSCWWGDENYRIRKGYHHENASKLKKWFWSFNWVVIRNSVWNYKMKSGVRFKVGFDIYEELIIPQDGKILVWRDQRVEGEQSVILKLKGSDELFYRYSYTLPLSKFNPRRILGFKYINKMRGVENRYLYKNRFFKKLI